MNKGLIDYVNLALPKGKLLSATSCLLNEMGLGFDEYNRSTRIYRLNSSSNPYLRAKMFQEKDIPIQVAVGNYDLGICGLDWIEELICRYPQSPLVKIIDLGYDPGTIQLAASRYSELSDVSQLAAGQVNWRIVTEYPNIAESAAARLRLKKLRIFPVWGAAEAYPPENADLVVLRTTEEGEMDTKGLVPLKTLCNSTAFLVANRRSLLKKDLSDIISRFSSTLKGKRKPWLEFKSSRDGYFTNGIRPAKDDALWMALPDGHQQKHMVKFFNKAGILLEGYGEEENTRRPSINLASCNIKVIRPQDMPLQVANGNFDIAITGIDWYYDHLYRFPTSPIAKLLDLGIGKVRMVAVVSESLPIHNTDDLKKMVMSGQVSPIRVASEYINIADRYLRDNHVSRYKVIPTFGSTEVFLPEDADLLIENTETGATLAAHNLRIIDTLFQSTACVIANKNSMNEAAKKSRINTLIDTFGRVVDN
jgi:ATP phosphoribosyltransferase